jgi:phosphohistidine phosphatase
MLRLTLLRHGKSSWDDPELEDLERPLAPRGLRDVPEMGRRLAKRGELPGLILSSPALRALSTARAIAREIGYREDGIRQEPALYMASPLEILATLQRLGDPPQHLMVVGHNPGLTELANMLDEFHLDNLPTAAILSVEFDASDWGRIEPASARLLWFDYPKKRPA